MIKEIIKNIRERKKGLPFERMALAAEKALLLEGMQNRVLPVDGFIPGCPPSPPAILAGIAKIINEAA